MSFAMAQRAKASNATAAKRLCVREAPSFWRTPTPGHSAEVKQQIVDMAMHASGIRDTARVLHISPTTVIKELKKGTCAATGEEGGVEASAPRARGNRDLSCRRVGPAPRAEVGAR